MQMHRSPWVDIATETMTHTPFTHVVACTQNAAKIKMLDLHCDKDTVIDSSKEEGGGRAGEPGHKPLFHTSHTGIVTNSSADSASSE